MRLGVAGVAGGRGRRAEAGGVAELGSEMGALGRWAGGLFLGGVAVGRELVEWGGVLRVGVLRVGVEGIDLGGGVWRVVVAGGEGAGVELEGVGVGVEELEEGRTVEVEGVGGGRGEGVGVADGGSVRGLETSETVGETPMMATGVWARVGGGG